MCYYVEINLSRKELHKRFNVPMIVDPRYMQANVFSAFLKPYIPVITSEFREIIQNYQWGLIPSWVKDQSTADKISNSTYNARAESIFEKSSFRAAANYKRCLVLAHGFFEWHTQGKYKIPYYIKRKDNEAFAFAGLYEKWLQPKNNHLIETVTIITTKANPLLEKIHNTKKRMPVILEREAEREFIDENISKKQVKDFLKPIDETELEAYPVNKQLFLKHKDPLDPEILNPVSDYHSGDLFETNFF